ncbi:hypothetical protein M3A74_06380 [Corynebacterium appendicis]|uniref:hypothetical protein n=1 Tax=Corynebacterium appendicis TaxID=163202 RepID=UPI00223C205A|nr:hypothetical protein [Corynebacterium appendicis]MCT1684440.1 hypothetical protein [Corynebacterium appendicis]
MSLRRGRLIPLQAANLAYIHRTTARSVFWELDPLGDAFGGTDSDVDKAAWLLALAYEQPTVGFSIADPATSTGARATLLMCPPSAAPGAARMPTAPFSADAYCLTSLHIDTAVAGIAWEAVLIDAAVAALSSRSLPAVEAFGFRTEPADNPVIGLMPVEVLESAGFEVVADHPEIPRLRLELPPAHGLLTEREVADLLAAVI